MIFEARTRFSVKSGHFCEKFDVFPAIFGEPEEAQANSLCYEEAQETNGLLCYDVAQANSLCYEEAQETNGLLCYDVFPPGV